MLAKAARGADRIVNLLLALLLLILFAYGSYSLYDVWQLYYRAADTDYLKYKPSLSDGGSSTSLAELAALNPDVAGWVSITDTKIDYPFVQGNDNMEYLNKDIFGEFSLSGSIFMDNRNDREFQDSYSLLYGHHMDFGAMFGQVDDFRKKDFFESHTTGMIYLMNETFRIRLFACCSADAYDQLIFDVSEGNLRFDELKSHIRMKALQYRMEDAPADGERIVALSTCSTAVTNDRTILFGVLSPIGLRIVE